MLQLPKTLARASTGARYLTAAGLAGFALAAAATACKDAAPAKETQEAKIIEAKPVAIEEVATPKIEVAAPDAGVAAAPTEAEKSFDERIADAKKKIDGGDFAGALAAARAAVEKDPKSWEAHHLAGRALLSQGKLKAAIKSLKTATEMEGAPSHAFNNLGYALLLANEPERAIDALEDGFERGPVTARLLNNLGLGYEKLGRFAEAESMFEGAVELRPGYVKAMVNLERVTKSREASAKEMEGKEDAPEIVPGG
jgi:Flp pilus assembly protein TadD